ncbi:MAG: DUF1284 domain-containing protein [Candidatus Omnitrophica bacterium]|nr:DUF1284 domain-containing protein [Candidatus Omnitrophota bacterium]
MIKKNADLKVKLVVGGDDICIFCPFFSNSKCMKKPDSEIILRKKEQQILSLLGMNTSSTVMLNTIYEKIRERFTSMILDGLCAGCEWYLVGDCKKGLENLKKKGGFL